MVAVMEMQGHLQPQALAAVPGINGEVASAVP